MDERVNEPQTHLSPGEIKRETERLLAVCRTEGVRAVLAECHTCRELLMSLAEACHDCGLTEAGQYLHYLMLPYD